MKIDLLPEPEMKIYMEFMDLFGKLEILAGEALDQTNQTKNNKLCASIELLEMSKLKFFDAVIPS